MVELGSRVLVSSVAFPAITVLKLPSMGIIGLVACAAASYPPGILQQRVVEPVHQVPAGFVAKVASRGLERPLMRVIRLMAHAARSRILEPEHEAPFVTGTGFMAGRTGCDGMGPCKLISALRLVLGSVLGGRSPTVEAVAKVTAGVLEDSFVRIHVAGSAILVLRGGIGPASRASGEAQVDLPPASPGGGMAGPALGGIVGSNQGVFGGFVVKSGFHGGPDHPAPPRCRVALPAPSANLTFVGVLVAREAIRCFHRHVANQLTFVFGLYHIVTIGAFHVHVQTIQRVGGSVVLKGGRALPLLLGVAGAAVLTGELVTVGIVGPMTGPTLLIQAQEGPGQTIRHREFLTKLLVEHKLRSVACPAFHLLVGSLQGVPRRGMREGVRIHPDQSEVFSQVLLVTGAAILLPEPPVVSCPAFDPRAQ